MLKTTKLNKFSVFLSLGLILFFSLPNFLSIKLFDSLPKFKLGLDLKGGSYIVSEIDMDSFISQKLDAEIQVISGILKDKSVHYKNFHREKNLIAFTSDEELKLKTVFRDYPQYKLEINNNQFVVELSNTYLAEIKQALFSQTISIIRNRIDPSGTKEIAIYSQGNNKIILEVPDRENIEDVKNLIRATARMSFHLMDKDTPFFKAGTEIKPKFNTSVLGSYDSASDILYLVNTSPEIEGAHLQNATITIDKGKPAIAFKFDNYAAARFAKITSENVGRPFAIVFDNRVISSPMIKEPITGGAGLISGHFTMEEAKNLATLLKSGALPAPLKISEERNISPIFGTNSIKQGKMAFFLAFGIISLFMIVRYRKLGICAIIALIFNILLIICLLSLLKTTLTLPGIAGIILTVGMAVDANIITYERVFEELKKNPSGKVFALVNGFKNSFATIMDSNLTTILAGLTIYYFGFGPIRGFATTLCLGTLTSLFSSLVLTKFFVSLWLGGKKSEQISF